MVIKGIQLQMWTRVIVISCIGKIIARDLCLVASRLYRMDVTRPWFTCCRYSFVRDIIAIIVVRVLAKCLQNLVWSETWCLIAFMVISFRSALVWGSLVEVHCGCSPKVKRRPGVNHYGSCFLGDGLDHVFSNAILMVSVGRTWFVCCATSSEHQSEGLVVIFSAAIVAPKSFHFISHGVNSGLK